MDFFLSVWLKFCKRYQGIGTHRQTLKHTERDTSFTGKKIEYKNRDRGKYKGDRNVIMKRSLL